MTHSRHALWFALFFSLLVTSAHADNWPGWRGPRGDGTSTEKNVPIKWSGTDNVVWKVPLPGVGHASPIVWEDRVFVVTNIDEARTLICLDRVTGKTLWSRTVLEAPPERIHRLNSRASSTPVTDGQRVYVSFLDKKDMFVAAYDFNGKQLWAKRPGVFSSRHGYCSSPILWKDKVIINGDHDGPGYLVALDRRTGQTVWKQPRPNNTRSYCTPIIRTIDGRNQMILSGTKCVASYDPDTGKQHWIVQGPTQQYVASLVYNGELLFLTCGFPELHMLAIDPRGSGDVTETHVSWHESKTKHASYVPSPISVGPYFMVVSDFGSATCYEAKSGRVVWREKLGRHFSASLVEANGLVYFTADQGEDRGEKGVTLVVRPGPTLDIVAKNVLDEPVYASPAISNGQLFLRGDKHLYCIGRTTN